LPVGAAWLGLLAPEDVVVWENPKTLLAELERKLAGDDASQAFVAANRLALELYRAGELEAAEKVCRQEIALARSHDALNEDIPVLLLGLQAAINLIRIHGYAGDFALALEGLEQLERLADGRPAELFDLSISSTVVQGTSYGARQLRSFARNNCVVETSKILYRRGVVDLSVSECGRLYSKWPSVVRSGPFHACEVLCIYAASTTHAPDRAEAAAPSLVSIARLHQLVNGALAEGYLAYRAAGLQLFEQRADSGLGVGLGQARYLAVLGDVLHRCAESASANICFGTAHHIASQLDPNLADNMTRRWKSYCHDDELTSTLLRAPKIDAQCLLSLVDLLTVTFELGYEQREFRGTASQAR